MRKLVTCPEEGRLALLETVDEDDGRIEFITYCSLWHSDEILASCRETCAERLNRRRDVEVDPES